MKFWLIGIFGFITILTLVIGKIEWDEKIGATQGPKVYAVTEGKAERELSLRPRSSSEIKPINLAILGSVSSSEDNSAWPALLAKELKTNVGFSLIEVTVKGIKDKTSDEVVNDRLYTDLIEIRPDILLIEPFLLQDNSRVKMSKRLENLSQIINDFKKANNKIEIIIQPSNPIFGTHYYQKEEDELQKYAKREGYSYIDHWEAWPSVKSKELQTYLSNNYTPNRKGHKLWANYLAHYFLKER